MFRLYTMNNAPKATIDYESRSVITPARVGSWKYSLHPSTEALCMAFRLPYWETGRTGLWHPAFPQVGIPASDDTDLCELFDWIQAGELLEAHNCFFERAMWTNISVPQLGWPTISPWQWRDSAAKAAAHAMHRALEKVGEAMQLAVRKGDDTAMKQMANPRKPIKADYTAWGRQHAPCRMCDGQGRVPTWTQKGEPAAKGVRCVRCDGAGYDRNASLPPFPILWRESRELFEQLFAYVRQDVLAEEAVSDALPDLNEFETRVFVIDQIINERGFQLDGEAVHAALDLIDMECVTLNAELRELTGGAVEKATQRDRMIEWLETQGLKLYDTRKETLDELLDLEPEDNPAPWAQQPLEGPVRRAIELMRILGRSSTAKFVAMRDWACADWRIRGGLLYHGADTGRWSGKGVQPHNFPKFVLDANSKPWKKSQDDLWPILMTRNPERIRQECGISVMAALSHGLRGAITASAGHQLYVADFAGIESRVLLWLADDMQALEVFKRKGRCECGGRVCWRCDNYLDMAYALWPRPLYKDTDVKERGIGKIAVLGLGYQMGAGKFVETAKAGGVTIPEDFVCATCGRASRDHRKVFTHEFDFGDADPESLTAVKIVDAFRTKFWRVKELWADTEAAAIAAVEYDDCVTCGHVTYFMEHGFLYCELPSGRRLAYPDPEIRQTRTSWGAVRDQLTFMGVDAYSNQWKRQNSYGGKLVENNTQAVARDLMAAALVRCEEHPLYVPVLSVHDELIAEAPIGTGDVKEFEHLMSALPEWAAGMPVEAEGWRGARYHK